jgi:subfamily B ATP-binding cassette protein MsbA
MSLVDEPDQPDQPKVSNAHFWLSAFRALQKLYPFLRPYRGLLVLSVISSAGIAAATAAYAWLVRPFLDGVFQEKDPGLIIVLPLALLATGLLKNLLTYLQSYLGILISSSLVADLRQQAFDHAIRLPIRFHDEYSSGRLLNRILQSAGQVAGGLPWVVKDVIQQVFTFLALAGLCFYLDWQLASVLLIVSPLSAYVISKATRRLHSLAEQNQQLGESLTVRLTESLSSIRLLKAYVRETYEGARFRSINKLFTQSAIKIGCLQALSGRVIETVGIVSLSAIVTYGGFQVIAGKTTPGSFYSFMVALILTYPPLKRLGAAGQNAHVLSVAASRVFQILDVPLEDRPTPGAIVLPPLARTLEFKDVSFRYPGSTRPALEQVTLSIRAGETIALVGRTGAGKTTLTNLLLRFYDPVEGAITFDGVDIQTTTFASLRRQTGIVPQETVLFDDTVKANIAYGREEATDAVVRSAAMAAYADEFISRLPRGYESIIGERGIQLSGGQRQRLAIARAIVNNPPILILDEATSSLDSESERLVQVALANVMRERTTIVIAHRLTTVRQAHRIVVLKDSRVVGIGPHEQLIESCEEYQRLYRAQFMDLDRSAPDIDAGESPPEPSTPLREPFLGDPAPSG